MTGRVARPRPRAEVLLEAAHRDASIVHEHHAALVRAGITAERLPDEVTRMAFALLGDHDRAGVMRELAAHWETLLHKGLARGPIGTAATPLLRLLAHALPATAEIAHVWQRLQAAGDAPAAPPAVSAARRGSRVSGASPLECTSRPTMPATCSSRRTPCSGASRPWWRPMRPAGVRVTSVCRSRTAP